MKKSFLLLLALVIASSLSAQIDTFSDNPKSLTLADCVQEYLDSVSYDARAKITLENYLKIHHKEFLEEYKAHIMSLKMAYGGGFRYVVDNNVNYNIIGEQLFCISSADISPTRKRYVIMRDSNGLSLSTIKQGEYYYVKDIFLQGASYYKAGVNNIVPGFALSDSLRTVFDSLPFRSDTLYYEPSYSTTETKLLDKSQPLPKKAKQYIIPKDDIRKALFPYLYKDDPFSKREDPGSIFILTDKNGIEYYVPNKSINLEVIKPETFWTREIKFNPGVLAGTSDFVVVKGVEMANRLFENQRMVQIKDSYYRRDGDGCYSRDEDGCICQYGESICKKIGFKDGNLVAALTDTLSTNTRYIPVRSIERNYYAYCQKSDTIVYLYLKDDRYGYTYYRKHDIDSVEAKNAYEKRMAEQEKLQKNEKKKQELIKKHGTKIGQSIAEGKACVGMTKEQCKEAMGNPDEVSKSTNYSGAVEVWTYSLGYRMFDGLVPITVVTFLNNKVTSVDEYTSWPY